MRLETSFSFGFLLFFTETFFCDTVLSRFALYNDKDGGTRLMMPEQIKFLNLSVEMCGVLLCILGIIVVHLGTKMERGNGKYFVAIFLCLAIDLLSNMTGILTKGMVGNFGFYAVRIANFCEFFFGYLLTLFVTCYLIYCVDPKKKKKSLRIGILSYYSLQILLLVISQFTHMYYYVDAANIYHRGHFFWLSQVVAVGTIVLNAVLIVIYRKRLTRRELMAFCCYTILPALAMVMQIFLYGLYLNLFSAMISAAFMFVFILEDHVDRYCEKERENTELKVSIMLSQIQPHFLYNTLDSIYILCEKDPDKAQKAVSYFADYLRLNLSSISRETPVTIETEMNHVKTYLELEKMSSEDTLNYILDIEAGGFMVPALSVQPLVENAVKHGTAKKQGGGTVIVKIREYRDCFEIYVIDDGAGFDLSQPPDDERLHLGMENVRRRLDVMCGGNLTVSSAPGKGTTAVIWLPKKREEKINDREEPR